MQPPSKQSLTRTAVAAYLCICFALLLLLGLSIWGAYRDVQYLRATLLQAEIARLRFHAERTVGRIERDFEQNDRSLEITAIKSESWLGRYWAQVISHEEERLYAALVDSNNTILLHSDPELTGQRFGRRWYESIVPDAGQDVMQTRSKVLAAGDLAYDIHVPIVFENQEIGDYQVGFDADWFDQWAGTKQNILLRQRAFIVGILLVVLLATTSLFYIATYAVGLRKQIRQSQLDRASEIAQLAAGLAHEIRNPMHAIRLNLYALAKVDEERRLKLSPEEHSKLLAESNREIQRIEKLMNELVSFASPDEPRDEIIDVKAEVQSTIAFISQEMLRQEISIETHFPDAPVLVQLDPGRLRQMLLNLIQNAEQAFDGSGRIDITINQAPDRATIELSDDGPGIPDAEHDRVFEPFYSTKSDGSGLGFALVRRFVTEAGGTVSCSDNSPQGTVFRIQLPRAKRKTSKRTNKQ